ncbi:hypothetical protein XO10_00050 [Marinitoga sp. 1135]|uniref:Lipoprotein n=1 Tax=Marinitoga piezophila (strain DSM 14283 / JCM 11233 / KA3) TaxID=443254 RepID=H2J2M6_MARPK|nr:MULTISPECIES: LPP20 family lipoprotein [Marinitoga]AEX84470.1 hypothetical protein Marpi_0010 [Marinitoga piezophila KA3]NUU94725.1 hypothetical protein [Marinitoga sp. 1135]NUU96654.1 hypothetical protein [Marinitoga sp. 1138]
MKRRLYFILALFIIVITFNSCGATNSGIFAQPDMEKNTSYHDFKGFGIIDYKTFPHEAQAKLAALEAARQDAYTKAVEYVYGTYIDSSTTVKDFVMQNKEIESKLYGLIKGAQEINQGFDMNEGMAWVVIRIYKKDIENIIGKRIKYF